MSEKYRVLALMTAAQAGGSIIQQGIGVLGPFFIAQFMLTNSQLGVMYFVMYLGSTLFTAVSGILTDRFGERTMVLAAGMLMGIGLLGSVVITNYVWMVSWMFLFGAGYAAATPAGGRAILTWFAQDRGLAMGVRQTGVPIGGLIGGLLLPLIALHFGGYRVALVVAALLVMVPAILAYLLYRDAGDEPRVPSSLAKLLRGMAELALDPRLIVVSVVSMILVSVQLAMIGFIAVTAINDAGVSATTAALAYSCAFGAATISRLFWGWFSDRHMRGERIVILGIMCGLAGFACLLIAALRPSLAALVIPAAIFVGFSGAGWNGIMAAALAEIGGTERAGSALGITLTVTFLASAVLPVVFGALADHTSLEVAWVATAALAFSGVIPVLWLKRRQRDLPTTDSAPGGA